MTELELTFPGGSFTLRGPQVARGDTSLLYHPSHLDSPWPMAPSRPLGGFTLERIEKGWLLHADGEAEPLGRYAEAVHALLAMEHSIEARLLAELDRGVALHAGAVVVDGAACLLMGHADSGKSSTTFQLLELGHSFLAEEIAVVDSRSRVRPHLQSIALDPRVVEEFQRDRELVHGRLRPVDELLFRYLPRRVATAPAPLSTVVLPRYRPASPARADELGLEESLVELLGYCFEPRGDPERSIERLIEIFTAARLVRLTYPDAASARTLLADLFGSGAP